MGFREFDQGITAYQLERQRLRDAEMDRQLRHSDLEIYLDILRPSPIRTTHAFGCSATILSSPSLMLPILQHPSELSTFFLP